LVFSNNDLLGSRIRNFKRMYERRVVFSIGVVYQTALEQLQAIPAMIREIVEAQENSRFDRAHFQKYGDFALVFEVVYYVKSPDYNLYMDIQQAINLEIYRRFAERDIEFAYPTQTILLQRTTGAAEISTDAAR
jgi:small-conductance mechanosensitive channel